MEREVFLDLLGEEGSSFSKEFKDKLRWAPGNWKFEYGNLTGEIPLPLGEMVIEFSEHSRFGRHFFKITCNGKIIYKGDKNLPLNEHILIEDLKEGLRDLSKKKDEDKALLDSIQNLDLKIDATWRDHRSFFDWTKVEYLEKKIPDGKKDSKQGGIVWDPSGLKSFKELRDTIKLEWNLAWEKSEKEASDSVYSSLEKMGFIRHPQGILLGINLLLKFQGSFPSLEDISSFHWNFKLCHLDTLLTVKGGEASFWWDSQTDPNIALSDMVKNLTKFLQGGIELQNIYIGTLDKTICLMEQINKF